MALDQLEAIRALQAFAELGDAAKDLRDEIKASRLDGQISPAEKRRVQAAVRKLARDAGPILLQLALDTLD